VGGGVGNSFCCKETQIWEKSPPRRKADDFRISFSIRRPGTKQGKETGGDHERGAVNNVGQKLGLAQKGNQHQSQRYLHSGSPLGRTVTIKQKRVACRVEKKGLDSGHGNRGGVIFRRISGRGGPGGRGMGFNKSTTKQHQFIYGKNKLRGGGGRNLLISWKKKVAHGGRSKGMQRLTSVRKKKPFQTGNCSRQKNLLLKKEPRNCSFEPSERRNPKGNNGWRNTDDGVGELYSGQSSGIHITGGVDDFKKATGPSVATKGSRQRTRGGTLVEVTIPPN